MHFNPLVEKFVITTIKDVVNLAQKGILIWTFQTINDCWGAERTPSLLQGLEERDSNMFIYYANIPQENGYRFLNNKDKIDLKVSTESTVLPQKFLLGNFKV